MPRHKLSRTHRCSKGQFKTVFNIAKAILNSNSGQKNLLTKRLDSNTSKYAPEHSTVVISEGRKDAKTRHALLRSTGQKMVHAEATDPRTLNTSGNANAIPRLTHMQTNVATVPHKFTDSRRAICCMLLEETEDRPPISNNPRKKYQMRAGTKKTPNRLIK
ncbi:MAG: hypothetical protein ABL985_12205 [Casimicrobium sp.]